jgi:hypothetical protein
MSATFECTHGQRLPARAVGLRRILIVDRLYERVRVALELRYVDGRHDQYNFVLQKFRMPSQDCDDRHTAKHLVLYDHFLFPPPPQ